MGTFFRGWRRKTGCVTLAMACVLTVGWLRSHQYTDEFVVFDGDQIDWQLGSLKDGLFTRIGSCDNSTPTPGKFRNKQFQLVTREFDDKWPQDPVDWWNPDCQSIAPNYQACGFRFAKVRGCESTAPRFTLLIVPYWSVTMTSIVLSAWLLLSKPPTPRAPATDPL